MKRLYRAIPDILTLVRLGGAFLIMAVLYLQLKVPSLNKLPWLNILLFFTFILFCTTDYLDGLIAKRLNLSSIFGTLFDPIADKVIIIGPLLILFPMGRGVHLIPLILMIIREFVVIGLRSVAAGEGIIIKASSLGKSKMFLQIVSVSSFLLGDINPFFFHKNETFGSNLFMACHICLSDFRD